MTKLSSLNKERIEMSSVALILSDNPYAPNGAAGYMKRLYESRELAKSYGIKDVSMCHGGVNFIDAEKYVSSLMGKTKQGVKSALLKTRWGTKIVVNSIMFRRGQNAIDMYSRLEKTPDVVVFNDFATHVLFMQQHSGYQGLKIQLLHNNGEFSKMLYISMPNIDPLWVEKVEQKTLDDSDVIVLVGKKSMNRFNALYPEFRHKSAHIHTGINDLGMNSQKTIGEKLKFVSVGTVCSRKNQQVLLEVALDDEINRRCVFDIVGGGAEYQLCKKRAIELGLENTVRFVGPSSNVVDYYRNADAFISVSRDEGLPTAALEAMSCGLPLVLTDVGSCEELIEGNGVLVPSCDSREIVEGIKKFLSLYDGKSISGSVSREIFERCYTTEAMWREYSLLIDDCLGVD